MVSTYPTTFGNLFPQTVNWFIELLDARPKTKF